MDFVKLSRQGNIGVVSVERPPINAIDSQLYREMQATFEGINREDAVHAVVLKSQGPMFMAGNDLQELTSLEPGDALAYAQMVNDSVASVYECRAPVVGAVQGPALGAGLAYAACCDVLVAAQEASFGIPEIRVGIVGAGCHLARLVPQGVLRYMAYTGKAISARHMQRYGAVHKIVPAAELQEAALGVAAEFLEQSPLALRFWKEALNLGEDIRLKEKYATESLYTKRLVAAGHFQEALAAFLEKRKPNFD